MIYTFTLNPALDVSGTVEQLIPDEKTYVYDEIHTPGGNGINAAIIAKRLGAPVCASGFLGGSNGEEILRLLSVEKLPQAFVKISGSTRMNLTVSNRKTHRQTRLSFPGPLIKASELRELRSVIKKVKDGDLVIIGGSLPPGVKPEFIAKLIKELKNRGVSCMVDMPGELLRDVLAACPVFIKPNLVEFQALVKKKVTSISNILPLIRNLKLPLVCVSSIEGGALLVSDQEAWFGKIPKVKIVSTVGAGDSMVGAIATLYVNNKKTPLADLLRLGLAASCATLTEDGLTLGNKKSIMTYYPQIYIRKIK